MAFRRVGVYIWWLGPQDYTLGMSLYILYAIVADIAVGS